MLSLFSTRDSWFFGDTTCKIWVYIAAHKNHCYIWWRIRASIPLPPLVTWSRYTTVVHYVGHFCRMDVFVMYSDSCITSKWCFDNLGLKIYLREHKLYIFPALIFYYFKFSNFFPELSADYILGVRIPLHFADQKSMLRSPPIHIVWATICRAVCLVLSVCYLSVCLSVLFCLAVFSTLARRLDGLE